MSDNEDVRDVGVISVKQGCSQLQSISILYCWELTDASLAAIGETCKGLTSIVMCGNNSMTVVGMASQAAAINRYCMSL